MGADLATLREKKAVRQAGKEGEAYVYGEGGVFATTSKLAELYVENPVGSNPYTEGWDLAKEHLAYWEPALQVGDESRREKGWEAGEFIEGSFTELFTKEGNPFCSNQAYFDCTVAIEKL